MMSVLSLASARLNSIPNNLLDGDLCKNSFDFHIFFFFLVYNRGFVIYIDITHVAASNTATDDVTK